MSEVLAHTLLLIPCSKSKKGTYDREIVPRRMTEYLSADASALLEEGRRLAWRRPGVTIDPSSRELPALQYYTGLMFRTPRLRQLVAERVSQGLHCLIVSGGYGLLRAEEPIHWYEAQIQKTKSVWKYRIPLVLANYVERNEIERAIGAFSKDYAEVLPLSLPNSSWYVPSLGQSGSIRKVPMALGSFLLDLLSSDSLSLPMKLTESGSINGGKPS
jgi:hypothetical protein